MTTITSLRKQLKEIRKKVAVSEEPMSEAEFVNRFTYMINTSTLEQIMSYQERLSAESFERTLEAWRQTHDEDVSATHREATEEELSFL